MFIAIITLLENVIRIDQCLIGNFYQIMVFFLFLMYAEMKPPSCATSPPMGDGAQVRWCRNRKCSTIAMRRGGFGRGHARSPPESKNISIP